MSIFGDMVSAIFGHSASATPQGAAAPTGAVAKTAAPAGVDVAAVLDKLATQTKQKLNWRKSIVDLMKPLNLEQACRTQAPRAGTALHRGYESLGVDEYLAS